MSVNTAFCVVAIGLCLLMRMILLRANRRLDAGQTTVAQEMKGESQASDPEMAEGEDSVRRDDFRFIA